MTAILVALGALVGAPARYLADRAIQSRRETLFPWGTLTVNVVASFILGLISGVSTPLNPRVVALIGTGFCGALSTYSTFGYETVRLAHGGARLYAVANVLVSIVAGVAAAALGWWIGRSIG